MKIKFKRFHEDAVFPERATEYAGGWDVVATNIAKAEGSDFAVCNLGFGLEIPQGYRLTLVPRSSLTKTDWVLQNSPGLGDSDFTGEYKFKFRCIPSEVIGDKLYYQNFPYKEGDRIGQVYLEQIIPMDFEEVEELSKTERGEGGYGSTGK